MSTGNDILSGSANEAFDASMRRALEQARAAMPELPDGFQFQSPVAFNGAPKFNSQFNAAADYVALEMARGAARGELRALMEKQPLSAEARAVLEARIGEIDGLSDPRMIDMLRAQIADEIQNAQGWTASEKNLNDMQLREQQIAALWNQIDQLNADMDDRFKAMRAAGIHFEDEDERKRVQILAAMEKDPHNVELQSQLADVESRMLKTAEPQLKDHPKAQDDYDKAVKTNQERDNAYGQINQLRSEAKTEHQEIASSANKNPEAEQEWGVADNKLSKSDKEKLNKKDAEWGADVTLNDVVAQNVGQKQKGGKALT